MEALALTPVALEFDPAYAAGRTLFEHLALDIKAREVLKKALSESGGAGTDTTIIDPIFSPHATAEDLVFFKENPSRTHLIRGAIEGEPVLVGRSPASEYVAVVRQVQSGVRLVVAIPLELMIIDSATRAARLNDDDVLAMVFEMATRATPGDYIYIDKIIAHVDEMRSTAAVQGERRRLS